MPRTILEEYEISMLRAEVEMLMRERQSLLCTVGAAARFIASMDSNVLPKKARKTAEILSKSLNELNDETLRDALEKVKV